MGTRAGIEAIPRSRPRHTTHLQPIGPHGAKVSLKAWLSLVEKDEEALLGRSVRGFPSSLGVGESGTQ